MPERLVVIGGGYIGLELGSVWSRLGSQVIILEALDRILPGLDHEIGQLAHRIFTKQGLEFRTGSWVEGVDVPISPFAIEHACGIDEIASPLSFAGEAPKNANEYGITEICQCILLSRY